MASAVDVREPTRGHHVRSVAPHVPAGVRRAHERRGGPRVSAALLRARRSRVLDVCHTRAHDASRSAKRSGRHEPCRARRHKQVELECERVEQSSDEALVQLTRGRSQRKGGESARGLVHSDDPHLPAACVHSATCLAPLCDCAQTENAPRRGSSGQWRRAVH